MQYIKFFHDCSIKDIASVGGKNASLGEMVVNLQKAGVDVPDGFAITANGFNFFMEQNKLDSIYDLLDNLDVENVEELQKTGKFIRNAIENATLPQELVEEIKQAYTQLVTNDQISVAVRSSATAEDLPDASFAGQQETFLNVSGVENVLEKTKTVYASLFTDRAISYRTYKHFPHREVSISVGVQIMIQSEVSGVMFSIDPESGFDVVMINAAYGLGEMVVQGSIDPDEYYADKKNLSEGRPAVFRRYLGSKAQKMIFNPDKSAKDFVKVIPVDKELSLKFALNDNEIEQLAKHAISIEKHYEKPMDIEWAKDGITGKLFVLQARPETVNSQSKPEASVDNYVISNAKKEILVEGRSVGKRIAKGVVKKLTSPKEIDKVQTGDILVANMTDPDWEPIMKRASAIVTDRGGRTCHAAIIARELGIPAIVGCVNATEKLAAGDLVTVSCAEGETGFVYKGDVGFEIQSKSVNALPTLPVKMMINLGNPDNALNVSVSTPNEGIGLARLEFVIGTNIGVHPLALLHPDRVVSLEDQKIIKEKVAAYGSNKEFYIKKLSEGLATLGVAFRNKPVIIRFSDFKSNEYRELLGGKYFEPLEENPMIGFRGASRYVSAFFKEAFAMECEAVKYVRDELGLTNIQVMIPFVRTVSELKDVLSILKENGLESGKNDLKIIMMCEIPSNVILANQFLDLVDGFSIGSNDLTQLTLGVDRDSGLVANSFSELDEAVLTLIFSAIDAAKAKGKYIGICGQGPSDHPALAKMLMERGISSISLNPDTLVSTWQKLVSE